MAHLTMKVERRFGDDWREVEIDVAFERDGYGVRPSTFGWCEQERQPMLLSKDEHDRAIDMILNEEPDE